MFCIDALNFQSPNCYISLHIPDNKIWIGKFSYEEFQTSDISYMNISYVKILYVWNISYMENLS
jgi:phage pi2 protein 07